MPAMTIDQRHLQTLGQLLSAGGHQDVAAMLRASLDRLVASWPAQAGALIYQAPQDELLAIESGTLNQEAARMIAEIVADDALVNSFRAVKKSGVLRDCVVAANAGLPTVINVVVFVNQGLVANQNEFVRVAAESEVEFRVAAELLSESCEPGFRSLP